MLPVGLLIGFYLWAGRRAQGQMAGIMNMSSSSPYRYSYRPR